MKRDQTPYGEAADVLVHQLVKYRKPCGFATLEDPDTHETCGIVLVCVDRKQIDKVIRFVESLGNFSTKIVPDEKR